jgi:uncharacterized protein YdcH (DUF465 family)
MKGGVAMEQRDRELCEKLSGENEEFREICLSHQEYKRQLTKLEKKGFLSSEEEVEKKRLKKLKLAAKDRMEQFLAKSR